MELEAGAFFPAFLYSHLDCSTLSFVADVEIERLFLLLMDIFLTTTLQLIAYMLLGITRAISHESTQSDSLHFDGAFRLTRLDGRAVPLSANGDAAISMTELEGVLDLYHQITGARCRRSASGQNCGVTAREMGQLERKNKMFAYMAHVNARFQNPNRRRPHPESFYGDGDGERTIQDIRDLCLPD